MRELIWIDKHETLTVHTEQIAEHGGSEGVRDEGLLESALARSQNLLAYSEDDPSLCCLAAAYGFGIARNHPVVDGNKRTALVVTLTFLLINGLALTAPREDRYFIFNDLAAGKLSEEELARWLEANTEPVSK
ncbi:MAG: type II toxin-antitoxin system death-on-curing family toxin [Acidobacteriaceae bacterium]